MIRRSGETGDGRRRTTPLVPPLLLLVFALAIPSPARGEATAADGYRALFSGREVFLSTKEKGVLLTDREDGKPLQEGSGKYRVLFPGDFFVDRSVRAVSEIRLGVASTKEPATVSEPVKHP